MRAIALYDCFADGDGEISFSVGQLILEVTPDPEPGWFQGRLENGTVGLFPGNYVRFEEDPPKIKPNADAAPVSAVKQAQLNFEKKETGSSNPPSGGLKPSGSSGSISSLATDFRANLRKISKSDERPGSVSDSEVQRNKVNPQSMRAALVEKSGHIALSGMERAGIKPKSPEPSQSQSQSQDPRPNAVQQTGIKSSSSATSLSSLGDQPPSLPRRPTQPVVPSAAASSTEETQESTSVEALRSKFSGGVASKPAQPPVVPGKPAEIKAYNVGAKGGIKSDSEADEAPRALRPSEVKKLQGLGSPDDTTSAPATSKAPWSTKPSEIKAAQVLTDPDALAGNPWKDIKAVSTTAIATAPASQQTSPEPRTKPAPPITRSSTEPAPTASSASIQLSPAIKPKPPVPPPSRGVRPIESPSATPAPPTAPVSSGGPPLPPRPNIKSDLPPPLPHRKPATSDVQTLTAGAKKRYERLFAELDKAAAGYLKGDQVRTIWLRSMLDNKTLGLIWNLADMDSDGMLSKSEFVVGMYLIDERLSGNAVPETLSAAIVSQSR
ncbi:uncharacterized protein BJ171DRAFT_518594 [Polychytrium aggregatum]|uniref:uncharacterized protein n=1 Tax=Polychytrium aggregatum TaxID=110093 RepID=UPI0022FEC29C|nr:uncharacterized protein BJ171DRAFT_518594 [Polychytrium aggregatum]KAI9199515.1 hypothetical protein BJ171DRAFT_518594 [Polychytrium aggregatum]